MKRKYKQILSSFFIVTAMVSSLCIPALAIVSKYDSSYLSKSKQSAIQKATNDYNKAYKSGNTAGMAAAHQAAESVRATSNYSGGGDGSEYHPWSNGSSGSHHSSGGGGSSNTSVTYTITASAGTGGSISPSESTSITSDSSKTYTITTNPGYKISNVKVDGSSIGTPSTYTFSSVTSDHTISAEFASNASVSMGGASLGDDGSGTLKSGNTTKSGYGVTANVSAASSFVSDTTVTASYNFTSAKNISLEYVNGSWQFPINSSSATGARKIYIPVEAKDGTYTITFTIKALDPQATALTGHNVYLTDNKSVTLTIKGSMYEDDFTGNS